MGAQLKTIPTANKHYLEAELEELIKGNQVWQFLREGSLDGIWYWDLENPSHEWMSPELWRLFGIDPATKAHDPAEWQDIIHPEDLATAFDNFEKHCANPEHPYDQIVRYRHADGSTIWVRCRGLAIRDEEGKPIRMLGAHNDITAIKAAEEYAREKKADAEQATEDLQTFAYSTSHDLKSPANTIRMILQEMRRALKHGDLDDLESLLTKAEATNDSMRRMVDDLLDYTRLIGAGSEHAEVDLDGLVAAVIKDMAGDIHATGAEVSVGKLGVVLGTEWQLRHLFQNLLSNAIKFQPMDHTPQVAIRATDLKNGRLHVEVADNGIGIAEADRQRIFDLFSKLHRPSSFKGSGIGLALCNRIATAHGSGIEIQSEPGHGAAFRFSLTTLRDGS